MPRGKLREFTPGEWKSRMEAKRKLERLIEVKGFWTQIETAQYFNVGQGRISGWLRGERKMPKWMHRWLEREMQWEKGVRKG